MERGNVIKYIGKGFLGFDKNEPFCKFVEFSGRNDAIITYHGHKTLVYKWEIEEVPK